MKKGILAILAVVFILILGFMEFQTPIAQAANTYTVMIKKPGKPVTKSKFKGYQFAERCKLANGEIKTLRFLSEKPLKVNKTYKIVIQDNHMLLQAKELANDKLVTVQK